MTPMPSEKDKASENAKAKRWRPRFSLRTLLIVVTLLCCYCWGCHQTASIAIHQIFGMPRLDSSDPDLMPTHPYDRTWVEHVSSPCPMVLRIVSLEDHYCPHGGEVEYCFWFFGPRFRILSLALNDQYVHKHYSFATDDAPQL